MDKKPGYIGSIAQTGTQKVKAPEQVATPNKKATVKTGKDLRAGKSK